MALYRYVKAAPDIPRRPSKRVRQGASFFLMSIGGAMLLWVVWPILSFSIISDTLFSQTITPVRDGSEPVSRAAAGSLSPIVFAAGTEQLSAETSVDYTNANIWYPTSPQKKVVSPVNTYSLTIPKLKIENALVTVGGDDLTTSIIHYGGTGLPGEYGTTVVFGHSTLPQFFSPTSYKSIFSTLPTLKNGDDIIVTYDGVQFRYVVEEMVVLDPTDLSVLEQRFDDSYITLVTCVPPGTYWKRLNVKARLSTL